MRKRSFTHFIFSVTIAFMAMFASCQKDTDVKDNSALKTSLAADSTVALLPGNFLATGGLLSLTIKDSTYVFDALKDSIAFINVHDEVDNKRYFGITAINKEHTMSFGISSSGYVHNDKIGDIAGSQFLMNPGFKKPGFQFSLSKYAGQKDFGNIYVDKYNQDSVLAKGTFHAFLAADDKANAPVFKVEGSFDLKLK
jgi:hypothetical protein